MFWSVEMALKSVQVFILNFAEFSYVGYDVIMNFDPVSMNPGKVSGK